MRYFFIGGGEEGGDRMGKVRGGGGEGWGGEGIGKVRYLLKAHEIVISYC